MVVFTPLLPPSPCFIGLEGLIWVPEKNESETERNCLNGIICLARNKEGTETVQFLPVHSIQSIGVRNYARVEDGPSCLI